MTIVATRSGKVEGFERNGVHVFRGIPYATPPLGALRWQAPQPEAVVGRDPRRHRVLGPIGADGIRADEAHGRQAGGLQ